MARLDVTEGAASDDAGPVWTDSQRRACLLVNPASGANVLGSHEKSVAEIWSALREAGIWAEIIETKTEESPTDLARRAAESGHSIVIAGGGDGTVGEVARGLVGTDCSLGILPMGTFNNFARALHIPADLDGACRVLARGRVRRIDVGVANDEHYFLEAAGVGIDAELFPLGEEIKSGNWHRLWGALKLAYQAQPTQIRFELDLALSDAYAESAAQANNPHADRPYASEQRRTLDFSAFMLIVANARYYGSGFTVAPNAVLDDGLFNIRLFRDFSKRELLKHFWSISRRRYAYSPKIDTFTASEIKITAGADLPYHVDGKKMGQLPLRLRCLRKALKVVA